jgi:hypothetical protein
VLVKYPNQRMRRPANREWRKESSGVCSSGDSLKGREKMFK